MKKDDTKYNQIGLSNRSGANLLNDDSKIINPHLELEKKKIVIELVEVPKKSHKTPALKYEKPTFLNNQNVILQTPEIQMLRGKNTLRVCPFCRTPDQIIIEYESSPRQKKICVILGVVGLFMCCWIPFLIKNLSNQIYRCGNCKKILATKGPGN